MRDEKGRFIKGNKVGQGKKKLPEDIKEARNMSYEEALRSIIEIRQLTTEDVKEIKQDKFPLGKRAILNAYLKLDYKGIKEYEDRLWGKAKESIGLTIKDVDLEYRLTEDEVNRIREELKIVRKSDK